ncbi:hypothetical protein BJ878DRAFT_247057 [Calycina marina]|uniref:Uncharacterized protein n=1 Tax=Calycina marina TaxID=1763456 RepID=A0A9P7Z7K8_9HELO|nr:hypothetical protein BJ878DRAFT_247057 [Calycina marina]
MAANHARFLLAEIEESSLEEILCEVRSKLVPKAGHTGIPELDVLFQFKRLGLTERSFPLIYHIIRQQLSIPNTTLCIVDLTQRFSISHLRSIGPSLLQHLHVFSPAKENFRVTVAGLEKYMLYGDHGSRGRVWRGTIVIGEVPPPAAMLGKMVVFAVNQSWRGWATVQREEVARYPWGVGPMQVIGERDKRHEKGWSVVSETGIYTFSQP